MLSSFKFILLKRIFKTFCYISTLVAKDETSLTWNHWWFEGVNTMILMPQICHNQWNVCHKRNELEWVILYLHMFYVIQAQFLRLLVTIYAQLGRRLAYWFADFVGSVSHNLTLGYTDIHLLVHDPYCLACQWSKVLVNFRIFATAWGISVSQLGIHPLKAILFCLLLSWPSIS